MSAMRNAELLKAMNDSCIYIYKQCGLCLVCLQQAMMANEFECNAKQAPVTRGADELISVNTCVAITSA